MTRRKTYDGPQLGRVRLYMVCEPCEARPVAVSQAIYELMRPECELADREHFWTIYLDNKHRMIHVEEVSSGSLTGSIVHPREVYKGAVLANAAALVFVHNHPSGDPTPSKEDLELTRRLRQAGEILGIRVLDHVIIGNGRYISFVDDGYWHELRNG